MAVAPNLRNLLFSFRWFLKNCKKFLYIQVNGFFLSKYAKRFSLVKFVSLELHAKEN